jgi:hypothetical protein
VTDEVFAANVTVVTELPPEVVANSLVPVEFDDKVTVVDDVLVVGLPKASWSVTVKLVVAEELAVALKPEEICNWVPEPALMVSCCVSDVRPVAEAVMVGVPACVSP